MRLPLLVFLSLHVAVWAFNLTVPVEDMERSGGLVAAEVGYVRLTGGVSGSWAEYEVTLPPWVRSFALDIEWWSPRPGNGIAVYLYDYDARGPDEILGAPAGLDYHWRLWSVSADRYGFSSSSPKFLLTRGDNPGGLRPTDDGGRIRFLVHVEGGLPFVTDELVCLERIRWNLSERDELWVPDSPGWSTMSVPAGSEGFDFERGLLTASATGRPPVGEELTARGRLMAIRAATVQALAMAVAYIGNVTPDSLKPDQLPGYRVLTRERLDDGRWLVEIGIPLNGPGGLADFLGYIEIRRD
jgi:hypothetical protein